MNSARQIRWAIVAVTIALGASTRAQTEHDLDVARQHLQGVDAASYPPRGRSGAFEDADYFDAGGVLRPNAARRPQLRRWLNCSTFAGPVLFQLCTGSLRGFDPTAAWARADGAGMAARFGLTPSIALPPVDFSTRLGERTWCREHAGLYFFELRGQGGHVGFVVLRADGTHRQLHFSATNPGPGPLDGGGFDRYVQSRRDTSMVVLYAIRRAGG